MKVLYNNCAKRILSNFLWNLKLLATSEQFLFKINQMIIKELKTTTLIKYLLEKMVWLQFIIFLYRKSFPWVKVFVEVVVPTTTSNVLSNVLWHNCSCYLKFYTLSKQTPKKIYYLLEFSFQNCFFFLFPVFYTKVSPSVSGQKGQAQVQSFTGQICRECWHQRLTIS